MKQLLILGVSVVLVYLLSMMIGKKFKISSRYERKPRILNSWSALDNGIDPTDQGPA